MRHESLYRLGGNAVLLGAILGGVAILLHAPQPMDLAAFSAPRRSTSRSSRPRSSRSIRSEP